MMNDAIKILKRLAHRYGMSIEKEGSTFKAVQPKVNPNTLCFGWQFRGGGKKKHILLFLFTRSITKDIVEEYTTHNIISLKNVDDAETFEGAYKAFRRIQAGPGFSIQYR